MFYGALVWDPWLIVAQIACLQCLHYLSLGALLALLVGTHADHFTLFFLFHYKAITAASFVGWCTVLAFFCNALVGASYLLLLVERTKKCLDFTATMYIVHTFFCLIYGGLPATLIWYVVQGVCLVITTVFGEWLCMRREQREIPMGGSGGGGGGGSSSSRAPRSNSRGTLPL